MGLSSHDAFFVAATLAPATPGARRGFTEPAVETTISRRLGRKGGDKPRPLHPADDPLAPFREVGFTNLAMGTIGLASLWAPSCRVPAVRAGEIFLLLAGIAHMRRGNRNATENAALWSDLAAAVILIVSVVSALVR